MLALADFKREKRGNATIWIAPTCADPAVVDALSDGDRLLDDPGCLVIKDQKKIKVGRISLNIAGAPRTVYVKKYNAFSLRYKLLSIFGESGARRSLKGAMVLHRGGIATPKPLAAVEKRYCGFLGDSFFLSEEIAGGKTANAYWVKSVKQHSGEEGFKHRRAFLSRLAALFHALHAQRIYHNDLKDANIMAVGNGLNELIDYFLLDLEGVKRCLRLSRRRRIKNLVQLYRTLGKYVPRSRQFFFLKCYLGHSFADQNVTRELAETVIKRARSEDRRKARGARRFLWW
jgi:lipopolysaccharide kinase (Kdo/WaaP) family protein